MKYEKHGYLWRVEWIGVRCIAWSMDHFASDDGGDEVEAEEGMIDS